MDHNRAWELIQKRQEYLDNLQSQAELRQAELKKLAEELEALTENRNEFLESVIQEAHEMLLEDKAHLVRQKYELRFEVKELEAKKQQLNSNIEFAWAEHNDLLKTTSNLNQEVAAMTVEVSTETNRGHVILKDLEQQIQERMTQKASLTDDLAIAHKELRDLKADILREQDIHTKQTTDLESKIKRYEDLITQNKRELEDTYLKLYKALDQLKDISSKDKAMREALADERIKLETDRTKSRRHVNTSLLEL